MRSTWGMVADGGSCMPRGMAAELRIEYANSVRDLNRSDLVGLGSQFKRDGDRLESYREIDKAEEKFPGRRLLQLPVRRLLQMGVWRPNPAPFATAVPAPFATGSRRLLQLRFRRLLQLRFRRLLQIGGFGAFCNLPGANRRLLQFSQLLWNSSNLGPTWTLL